MIVSFIECTSPSLNAVPDSARIYIDRRLTIGDAGELSVKVVLPTPGEQTVTVTGPLLEAKRGIADVAIGGIMEVISSDEGTNKDIPRWCKKLKHDFI